MCPVIAGYFFFFHQQLNNFKKEWHEDTSRVKSLLILGA